MAHPLDGARAKLERARVHLADVQAQVAAYVGTQPVRVDERDDLDGDKRHIVWVATAGTTPPPELGVVLGDWAHNVRAALDYTAYELVRRETGEDDPRWTQFPAVVAESRYAAQEQQRLRGAPVWSLPVFHGRCYWEPLEEGRAHLIHLVSEQGNERVPFHGWSQPELGNGLRLASETSELLNGLVEELSASGALSEDAVARVHARAEDAIKRRWRDFDRVRDIDDWWR